MPFAWYIVPYKRRVGARRPTRYCAMDDFTPLINSEGGAWSETEVLGDVALVKVRASAPTLSLINSEPGFVRLPKDALDLSLSDLTPAQKQALRDKAQQLGYGLAEISTAFPGDLGTYTLRDVLRFLAGRRLKPRYDSGADTILLDGAVQSCRSIEDVDGDVR